MSDFTVRKARQRTASNIAVETRTGKDGKAQTMPMTPGLVLRELFKSRRGRGVRTVYSKSLSRDAARSCRGPRSGNGHKVVRDLSQNLILNVA